MVGEDERKARCAERGTGAMYGGFPHLSAQSCSIHLQQSSCVTHTAAKRLHGAEEPSGGGKQRLAFYETNEQNFRTNIHRRGMNRTVLSY